MYENAREALNSIYITINHNEDRLRKMFDDFDINTILAALKKHLIPDECRVSCRCGHPIEEVRCICPDCPLKPKETK